MVLSYRQLTSSVKQKIFTAFQEGMECREIPRYLHVSDRAVRRVLQEAGINTKRRNRYQLDETYFDVIDSEIKAYLLSLMAADGCVTSTNYIVYDSVESSLVTLLKDELKYQENIRIIYFPQGYAPHYRLNFSSQTIARALTKYGVVAGRTESGVYYLPDDQYLGSYLLGYFDGDGCAYVNQGRSGGLVYLVGSKPWVQALQDRLKMGKLLQHISRSVYYCWRIYSREDIQKFYNLLYLYQIPNLGLAYLQEI
ncbi:endonuclease [Trichothermofontia sichuanensis B231]|uniref:LAGLIDADG family homing endonuclease n=1 Tax=Trichothermofontia sichuanensis TaxID=3045816 RepID=UPI0022473D3E|nr:LAGLIDADG family homing endonuclease [Trichothermofontia sichuanensis]UZQ53899.1 endonuclease [Trichothermofontia sichuanensis B231]